MGYQPACHPSTGYTLGDILSNDMKACYPASFQGMGEAKPYFKQFSQLTHHKTSVSNDGSLSKAIVTSFAEV